MSSPNSRFLSVPTAALLALTVLAGCGSNSDEPVPAESSASSASSAAATTATETSAAAETSSAAAVQAELPEGYKLISAPKNGLSFGVPEGWLEVDSQAMANDAEIQAYLEQAGSETGMNAEMLKQQMAQLDLMAMSATRDAAGFAENVNVLAEPVSASVAPSVEEAKAMVEEVNGTAGAFAEVQTSLGEGVTQAYTAEVAGVDVGGVYIIVPAGTGDGYSIITVSASDTAKAQEVADNIVKSLQKN